MKRWLVHREVPSPNWNERRLPVSMVVLHYTGMESAAAAIERLCDPAAQVSAHYLIDEDGTVVQLVDEAHRAIVVARRNRHQFGQRRHRAGQSGP